MDSPNKKSLIDSLLNDISGIEEAYTKAQNDTTKWHCMGHFDHCNYVRSTREVVFVYQPSESEGILYARRIDSLVYEKDLAVIKRKKNHVLLQGDKSVAETLQRLSKPYKGIPADDKTALETMLKTINDGSIVYV